MSRFEKRITDEQIATARQTIAEGATLRAAAAEIPCAPSTLSYRIKKAEQAEAAAHGGGEDAWPEAPVSPASVDGVDVGNVGPLEILREALQATKARGQPDWATRLSAARTLATLRPQDLEPTSPKEITTEIVVFDLEPGALPVKHRPRRIETETSSAEEDAGSSSAEAAGKQQRPATPHLFFYQPPDAVGPGTLIGQWFPAPPDRPTAAVQITVATTEDPATAERWRAELSAGRFPADRDDP